MHVLRKELCLRMILMLSMLVGMGYYAITAMTKAVEKAGGVRVKPIKVERVKLPPHSRKELIAAGVSLVEEKGRGGMTAYLMPSLVEKKRGRVETARLSMLVQGKKSRYAMINDRMYRKGDTLPDGRKVVSIDSKGVMLSALGKAELLPWVPPLKVELKKSAPKPVAELQSVEGASTVENPLKSTAQKVVMDADKALELLKKLEATDGKTK